MLKGLAAIGNRILDAVFPEECVVCERPLVDGERYMCLHCMAGMPRLDIESFTDNRVHATLASTHPVHKAAALFRYRKGSPYTRLIHFAKYNDRPRLARWLGVQLATAFHNRGLFDGVDALVPVPVSRRKIIARGFNQSHEIALGIASVTGIQVADVLKARHHSTQTRQNAVNRRRNATGVYSVADEAKLRESGHILLVDDVITTGSTLLECAEAIRKIEPALTVGAVAVALSEL